MDKKELLIRRRHLMMGSANQERDWSLEPFTFIARTNCNILGYSYDESDNFNVENVLISINGGPLQRVTVGTTGYWSINNDYITLNAGDEMAVYIDGNLHVDFYDIDGGVAYGTYDIAGNIMSLRYGQDFLNHAEFGTRSLLFSKTGTFQSSTQVVDASNLIVPGTIVPTSIFRYMFQHCEYLEKAPKILPATTLAEKCYQGMFYGCTNLITAPELPATTLVTMCYYTMFTNCSSLNKVHAMFLTTPTSLRTGGTRNWLNGVSPTGTFYKNKNATWNVTGAYAVPEGWDIVLVDP